MIETLLECDNYHHLGKLESLMTGFSLTKSQKYWEVYRLEWLNNFLGVLPEDRLEFKKAKKRFIKAMKEHIPSRAPWEYGQVESFVHNFLLDKRAEILNAEVAYSLKHWLQTVPGFYFWPGLPMIAFLVELRYENGERLLADVNIEGYFHEEPYRDGGIGNDVQ